MPGGDERSEAAYIGSVVRDVGAEPVGVGCGTQLREGNGGVGCVDPVGVGKVGETQGAPSRQWVIGREQDSEGFRSGRACSMSRSPAAVGPTGRRSTSRVPRSFSRAAMCCDTADWV